MKIAICNELFQGWPIQKVFDYAAGLGYDGVEIAPFTLADSVVGISQKKRTEIRRAAEKSGIEIVGLHLLLAKPEGLHISHPDEIIRVRTQEYIEALIHLCADIGGDLLLHGSSHQRKIEDKWGLTESKERARETFEICLKTARRRKVTYCIEPLLKANTNFINTVEEALRLIEEINQPSFRLVFDCRSASVQERSVTDALVKAIKSGHLRHIHINDVSGKGPGFGDTRFTPILKTLIKYGYRGYISVEVFDYGPDPQTIASRSIGYLKGILETLE